MQNITFIHARNRFPFHFKLFICTMNSALLKYIGIVVNNYHDIINNDRKYMYA